MNKTYSAGGVVVNSKGQVLVVNQKGRSWSLPKGHIEPGEDPLTAARREIYEESGLTDLIFVRPLGSYDRPRIGINGGNDPAELKNLTFFLFHTRNEMPLRPMDPDNPEAQWVNQQEVSALLTHPRDREFFEAVTL